MDLTGKNVVYLGGFGGIGQKACAQLLERQIKVGSTFDRDKFSSSTLCGPFRRWPYSIWRWTSSSWRHGRRNIQILIYSIKKWTSPRSQRLRQPTRQRLNAWVTSMWLWTALAWWTTTLWSWQFKLIWWDNLDNLSSIPANKQLHFSARLNPKLLYSLGAHG